MDKSSGIGYYIGGLFCFMGSMTMIVDIIGGADSNKVFEQLMKIHWYIPLGFGAVIACMQNYTNRIIAALKK